MAVAEAFLRTQSRETTKNTSLPPRNAIITSKFQLPRFQCWLPKLLSGHQTTLHTVHSRWSARNLDCTKTELHSEGWKGWAYEYQNSWTICDVNRILQSDWSCTISCGRHKTWYWRATQLSAQVIWWAPPNYHPHTHTHTHAHILKERVYYTSTHPLTVGLFECHG